MRNFSFGTIVMMVAMMVPFIAKAQLAGGTYTINSGAATGGTNFISFGAAVTAMASGISGPVVFNVVAGSGPYTEQVTIGNITNASATNTIKFNGNGATVQYTATATYQGVLMMNGAKYVKIDSLTFKTLSVTYGTGAILYNTCNFDSLTRCTFDLGSVTSTVAANSQGIRISSVANSTSTTVSGATNSYFGYNKINGSTGTGSCYYGVFSYGPNNNNVFAYNLVQNFYYFGMYMYYGVANKILYNTITRQNKVNPYYYGHGVYAYYMNAGTQIVGNRIHTFQGTGFTTTYSYFYGLNLNYNIGTAADPFLVANNVMYNMPIYYGIYNYTSTNGQFNYILHNTIACDSVYANTSPNYGMQLYYPTATMLVKNNLVSIRGGGTGTKYGVYTYPSFTTPNALSRNNVFVSTTQPGTAYYSQYNNTNYSTFAAFQAANTGQEVGSVSVVPNFTAPGAGNFAPTNTAMFGNGANVQTLVPIDIIGQSRLAAPAPGAWEFQANGVNNAGMVSLVEPLGRYCPGAVPVKATIYNGGTNNITSVKVNWSLNGVVQTPITYTG
ncbi:MAG: hypothetical protein EOP51_27570, partial [Sphingobacteriales bacterium]